MKKRYMIIGAALVLTGVAVWSVAQVGPVRKHGAGAGKACHGPAPQLARGTIGRWMVLRSELDITDDQREQIKSIVQSHRDAFRPLIGKVVAAKRALREAVIEPEADEARIRAAAAELGREVGEAAVLASKVAAEVRPVLTEEQIERLEQFRVDQGAAVDRWIEKHSQQAEPAP
jgi:Spy/CpxP family protein refolding chaperone